MSSDWVDIMEIVNFLIILNSVKFGLFLQNEENQLKISGEFV